MEHSLQPKESRRNFLVKGGMWLAAAGLLGAGCSGAPGSVPGYVQN